VEGAQEQSTDFVCRAEKERVEREGREERKRNEAVGEFKGALCTALWEAGGGRGILSYTCILLNSINLR
jgi:hypothetical protein